MADIDRIHLDHETLLGEGALEIRSFLEGHYATVRAPIYTSADVRDAGFKAASVDANAFPAGFNNLCPKSREGAARELGRYFDRHHAGVGRVLLLPEDHTRNPFYVENVLYLSQILDDAGIDHVVGSADPEVVYGIGGIATPQGATLDYALVTRSGDDIVVGGERIDLVFSNNDFTTGVPEPLRHAQVPIVPDPRLGWDHRSKAKHFALYNDLAERLAERLGLDPWHLTVPTFEVGGVDFKSREGLDRVAHAVDRILGATQDRYDALGVEETPRAFVKDASGTYGMGIMAATSAEDVLALNSRGRQKMDKGKYGHKVDHVIVQEGVPTRDRVRDQTAEPVIYMVRGRPIGAFYRMHHERDAGDNLNQPGMTFMPVCQHKGCHDEPGRETVSVCLPNIETLVAELAALALAYEATPAVMDAKDATGLRVPTIKVA